MPETLLETELTDASLFRLIGGFGFTTYHYLTFLKPIVKNNKASRLLGHALAFEECLAGNM